MLAESGAEEALIEVITLSMLDELLELEVVGVSPLRIQGGRGHANEPRTDPHWLANQKANN